MVRPVCLSEEHGRGERDAHRGVFQVSDSSEYEAVSYRPFQEGDQPKLFPVMLRYWKEVNGRDLSNPIDIDVYGQKVTLPEVEAKLYELQALKCRIQLAIHKDEIIGFLLYHLAYSCILHVEGLYVMKGHEGKGIGKGVIESLNAPIQKIFFQTHKSIPPFRLFDVSRWVKKLFEDGDLITWEMGWE